MLKTRGVNTMLIGRDKGQWVLLGIFSQFLGFTFVRGSLVKGSDHSGGSGEK